MRQHLLSDLSLVESQLLALQDVSVTSTTLTRSRADDSVHSTSLKLLLQSRLDLTLLLQSLLVLVLNALRHLLLLRWLLLLSSSTNGDAVMSLIPSSEWRGINLHDGRSGKGIRSDKFVVRRVESDDNDTGLARDSFTAPAEIARVESETSELSVSAAGSYEMDSLRANTCVGWLTTFLKGSLLSVVCAFGTGCRALVAGVS